MLTIYKASAGSGKTYTLTYEYLRTLLGIKDPESGIYRLNGAIGKARQPHRHRHLLAITFTNAATEEMKSRIVRELKYLADASPEAAYTQALCQDYGCSPQDLQKAATTALREVLYDYNNFNVSTIDSFFQQVLRTFSREVDHQGDYELSLDTKDIIRQTVSLMLDDLNYHPGGKHDRLYRWIRRLMLTKLQGGSQYNIFDRRSKILRNLTSSVADSMDEVYSRYSAELAAYLEDASRIAAFDKCLEDRQATAFDKARNHYTRFLRILAEAGIPEEVFDKSTRVRSAGMENPPLSFKGTLGEATTKMKLALEGESGAETFVSKANLKKYDNNALDSAAAELAEFCRSYFEGISIYKINAEMREQLGTLDFIGLAQATLETFLRDNNLVLISDTGELLSRIISDAEMPFIYERLGMKLTNLLIDEFQDTSRLQWKNLKPLVSNSIAEGHDNLIIGDEKQAIYRWRNSDSELLGSVVQNEDFPNNYKLRGTTAAENTNYRSSGTVVRFNNSFFTALACNFGANSYGNVAQHPSQRYAELPGYVRFTFKEEDELPDEAVLEAMCTDILRQHNAGYMWRDILILSREKSEARLIAEYIIANHPEIRILSSEALLLNSSAAVRSIMSLLKLVSRSYNLGKQPDKDSDKPRYATQDDIVMMITRFSNFIARGIDNATALEAALSGDGLDNADLNRQVKDIRATNPANLVALIEAIISYKLNEEQRSAEYAYIAALQDLAVKHCEGPDPSLAAFLAEYDRNINRWAIKASSDLDAVEIMTIHKSKGLERACVHIPFGDWELVHNSAELWIRTKELDAFSDFAEECVPPIMRISSSGPNSLIESSEKSPFINDFTQHRELERTDNLNLTYVAYTRAARELIVHSRMNRIGKELIKVFSTNNPEDNPELFIPLAEYFDATTGVFELGCPTAPHGASKALRATVDAGEYMVYRREDIQELVSIDDILSRDFNDIGGEVEKEITDSTFEGTPEMKAAAERGTKLHSVLAGMRTLDELEASLSWQLAAGEIRRDEVDEFREEISSAIADGGDMVTDWFNPEWKIYPERSIYVPDSDESYRPDRVIVRADGSAAVIDYKFTSAPRRSHVRQVTNYMKLLADLGRPHAEGYIWYPALRRIIKV